MRKNPSGMNACLTQSGRSENMVMTVAALFGHAIASANIIFIAWLLCGVPASQVWAPYLALAGSGLALSPFLYWARVVRRRVKASSILFTIGMGLYAEATAIACGYVATRLHVLSLASVLDAAPFVLALLAILTIPIYPATRRMLEKRRSPG